MARLTGAMIRSEIARGAIQVTPYDPSRVDVASIDLTLGAQVRVYKGWEAALDWKIHDYHKLAILEQRRDAFVCLDCRKENDMVTYMLDDIGLVLFPRVLYLMHTEERIHTLKYEADVTGKSSLARLGIVVHKTAGFIDPGFDGQYTLEVTVEHPTVVYKGQPFCQVRFGTLEGDVEDYRKKGNYTGAAALGAQPSRSWRQR